jgi:hypothetical protein
MDHAHHHFFFSTQEEENTFTKGAIAAVSTSSLWLTPEL